MTKEDSVKLTIHCLSPKYNTLVMTDKEIKKYINDVKKLHYYDDYLIIPAFAFSDEITYNDYLEMQQFIKSIVQEYTRFSCWWRNNDCVLEQTLYGNRAWMLFLDVRSKFKTIDGLFRDIVCNTVDINT
jgi:hypothetical protein